MSVRGPTLPETPVGGRVDAHQGQVPCASVQALEAAQRGEPWGLVVYLSSVEAHEVPRGEIAVTVKDVRTGAVETKTKTMTDLDASLMFSGAADAELEVSAAMRGDGLGWAFPKPETLPIKADGKTQGLVVVLKRAAIAAVSVSGFPETRFHFAGFLPRKQKTRGEMLGELRALRSQLVFYESPQRLGETLRELHGALGDRTALVARELTKVHEELARGTLSELATRFAGETRGEIVIVVSGAGVPEAADPAELEQEVRDRLARGERPKGIAEALGPAHGKREVYQLALRLQEESD